MAKHKDSKYVGRSDKVPYREDETSKERHARRWIFNNEHRVELMQWCETHGFTLDVKNDGHHFIISREDCRAQWWPSSAKLVVNNEWKNGHHCHDWTQVVQVLEKFCEER